MRLNELKMAKNMKSESYSERKSSNFQEKLQEVRDILRKLDVIDRWKAGVKNLKDFE